MKISIIGAGVVGKATADCFLRFGHSISCVDVDAERLQALKNEGFDVLEKATDADVHFICTSDPSVENALAMLSDVTGLIAIRSTITPGSTQSLMEKYNRHICFVPEFLRASTALQDELNPWRVVIGFSPASGLSCVTATVGARSTAEQSATMPNIFWFLYIGIPLPLLCSSPISSAEQTTLGSLSSQFTSKKVIWFSNS